MSGLNVSPMMMPVASSPASLGYQNFGVSGGGMQPAAPIGLTTPNAQVATAYNPVAAPQVQQPLLQQPMYQAAPQVSGGGSVTALAGDVISAISQQASNGQAQLTNEVAAETASGKPLTEGRAQQIRVLNQQWETMSQIAKMLFDSKKNMTQMWLQG